MTDSNRFEKPGTSRDFTRSQFEIVQSSREREKFRAQAQRTRKPADDERPAMEDPDRGTPTATPKTKRPNSRGTVNQKRIADTE